MVTIFSRPAGPSLAARYSCPRPVTSLSSRRTSFPNFSRGAMKLDAESNMQRGGGSKPDSPSPMAPGLGLLGEREHRFEPLRVANANALPPRRATAPEIHRRCRRPTPARPRRPPPGPHEAPPRAGRGPRGARGRAAARAKARPATGVRGAPARSGRAALRPGIGRDRGRAARAAERAPWARRGRGGPRVRLAPERERPRDPTRATVGWRRSRAPRPGRRGAPSSRRPGRRRRARRSAPSPQIAQRNRSGHHAGRGADEALGKVQEVGEGPECRDLRAGRQRRGRRAPRSGGRPRPAPPQPTGGGRGAGPPPSGRPAGRAFRQASKAARCGSPSARRRRKGSPSA